MSVAFDEPSLAVDTHVERVSKRLGINKWKDNVKQVEERLCDIIPKERWSKSHHQLIFLDVIIVLLENQNVIFVHYLRIVEKGKTHESNEKGSRNK